MAKKRRKVVNEIEAGIPIPASQITLAGLEARGKLYVGLFIEVEGENEVMHPELSIDVDQDSNYFELEFLSQISFDELPDGLISVHAIANFGDNISTSVARAIAMILIPETTLEITRFEGEDDEVEFILYAGCQVVTERKKLSELEHWFREVPAESSDDDECDDEPW